MAKQRIELPIIGMTCAGCAATVERTLTKKVPVIIIIAGITLGLWCMIGGEFVPGMIRMVAVQGILFKNSEALQTAHRISTIIFNKTGEGV